MMTKNWMMRVVLGAVLLLSGCAETKDPLVLREGYHKRLQSLSVNEAAKISSFFGSTLFVVPEGSPLTCEGIVRGVNAQLMKEGKALRVAFEFSRESEERFLPLLGKPLTAWQGTLLDDAAMRAQLAAASLSDVVNAVSAQLGLNVVWYSGAVVLTDHFIGG